MTPNTDTLFDTALRELAALASSRYPGEHDRLGRGLILALNGHVTLLEDGTASVRSGKDPEVAYGVAHGKCDCPDASRAPDARCKHLWAAVLMRRARYGPTTLEKALEPAVVADADEPPETEEPLPLVQDPARDVTEEVPRAPLPEAAASLNIELKFGSGKVMYTARGHSDEEVLARLPEIIAGMEQALASGDETPGFFTRLSYAFWPRKQQTTCNE